MISACKYAKKDEFVRKNNSKTTVSQEKRLSSTIDLQTRERKREWEIEMKKRSDGSEISTIWEMGAVLVERKNHSLHSNYSFSRVDSSLAIVIHDWGIWNGSRANESKRNARRMKNRSLPLPYSITGQSDDRERRLKHFSWETLSRRNGRSEKSSLLNLLDVG